MERRINFAEVVQQLRDIGNDAPREHLQLRIPDAKDLLWMGLQQLCDDARWLPEYNDIAMWMSNNQGKGLCLLGNCGVGKTLICSQILPVIFLQAGRVLRTFTAMDMNRQTDTVLQRRYKVIDDIGTEDVKVEYGERRMVFNEVVDRVERRGEFLIVTSNLSPDEIIEKYGERTFDRLCGTTKLITISGKSMRRAKKTINTRK